ncbi:BTB/POZ domain-containing protein At1g01640-like [Phoenix dactylifera]|uniref:BTB/POZ domain-containing protein At1g01640-like n=1 Tax=Phoenix dactylifera TaxID=42345 RepID=A0A8B7CIB3_PHODC|nr:BTB/POZ domain-containing protein At1g01640-like [Phoenix dactylifera]
MDCCICGATASFFKPPRNSICSSCYEGAKGLMAFSKELDGNQDAGIPKNSHGLKPNISQGLLDAFKHVKKIKEKGEELNEKLSFLDGLVLALRDGIHTDIMVKPGTGAPIAAHRALLATKSEIFRTMLGSDVCKAPAEDTISLSELSHDELKCLLEFLYAGCLPKGSADKHLYSMLVAADKYDIPFLRKVCEHQILDSMDSSNALDILEVSEVCSNRMLKDHAMNSVVRHVEDVVFSTRYDEFALKNARLCVEITRAFLREMKDKKEHGTSN